MEGLSGWECGPLLPWSKCALIAGHITLCSRGVMMWSLGDKPAKLNAAEGVHCP